MDILGNSEIKDESYNGQTKREKESQLFMDEFYKKMGWIIDRSVACKEYDLKINNSIIVEEKFIYNDCDNILIEFVQNVINQDWGWFYKTEANYLFFIVTHEYLYAIKWMNFKEWFINELTNGTKFRPIICTKGYGYTINLAIERNFIPRELYQLFILNS